MSDQAGGEGFARRWSRLKRQAVAPRRDVEPEPVPLAEAPFEPAVEIPPPAETIPLEEITGWLSKRLPEGWREAALRRVWSADIDIRDFKGLADYAWDYTSEFDAPPGFGPMRATDDMVRLLARAIGEPLPLPELPSDDLLAETTATPTLEQSLADASVAPQMSNEINEPSEIELPTPEPQSTPESRPDRILRRGGRATPV